MGSLTPSRLPTKTRSRDAEGRSLGWSVSGASRQGHRRRERSWETGWLEENTMGLERAPVPGITDAWSFAGTTGTWNTSPGMVSLPRRQNRLFGGQVVRTRGRLSQTSGWSGVVVGVDGLFKLSLSWMMKNRDFSRNTTTICPEGAATHQPGATPREQVADPDPCPERAKPARQRQREKLGFCAALSGLGVGNSSWSRGVAPGWCVAAPSGQESTARGRARVGWCSARSLEESVFVIHARALTDKEKRRFRRSRP